MKPQNKRWLSMLLALALAAGGLGGVTRPAAYAAEMDEAENGGATENNEGSNTEEEPGGTPGPDLGSGEGDGVPGTDPDDEDGDDAPGTNPDDEDGDGVPGTDPEDEDGDGVSATDPDDGVSGTDPDDSDGDDALGTDAEDEDDSENEEVEDEDEETTGVDDEQPGVPEEGLPVAQFLAEGVLQRMGVFGAPPSPVDGLWPNSGSVDVDIDAQLVITFSGPITYDSGKFITIRESDGTGFITIRTDSISLSGDNENIVIINHPGLKPNTTYYVEIDSGAFAVGDIPIGGFTGSGTWSFTTGSRPRSSGGSSSDNDDSRPLPTDVSVNLRYETEEGSSLGSQRVNTDRGSTLSLADLDLPDGYRLKDPNWRYKADFSGPLSVILEPVPEEPAQEPGEPPLVLLVDMPHYIDRDTGTVMVALRPMAEASGVDGGSIQWDEAEQRATVTYPDTGISMDFIAGETTTRVTYPTVQPYPGGEEDTPESTVVEEGEAEGEADIDVRISGNGSKTETIITATYIEKELDPNDPHYRSKYKEMYGTYPPEAEDAAEPAVDTEPAGDTELEIIINKAEYAVDGGSMYLREERNYYLVNPPSEDAEDTIDNVYPEIDALFGFTTDASGNGADAGEPAGDTESESIVNEEERTAQPGVMEGRPEETAAEDEGFIIELVDAEWFQRESNTPEITVVEVEREGGEMIFNLDSSPNTVVDGDGFESSVRPPVTSDGGNNIALSGQTKVVLGDGTVILFVSSQAGPRESKPAAITIPNGAAPATDSVGYGWEEVYIVYEEYINNVLGVGIVSGYPDGTFESGNIVSYDEAETMLVGSLGYTSNSETQPAGVPGSAEGEPLTVSQNDTPETDTEMSDGDFGDVSSNWFHESVDYVVDEGLYAGASDNFGPNTNTTRGMFITILDDPEKEYIEFVADLPAPPAMEEGSMFVPLEAFRFIEVFNHSGAAIGLPGDGEHYVYGEGGQLIPMSHEKVDKSDKYY